jgi:hypothetical protein
MIVETHTSTTTWVAPAGTTTVQIEAYAGGGGGTNASGRSQFSGGAGGQYAICTSLTVVPGNGYILTVGAGGAFNGSATPGSPGGDSWMSDTGSAPTSVAHGALAKGGAGAGISAGGTGSGAGGIGNTVNAGGSGFFGTITASGGGAGGPTGAGGNASQFTGGTAGGGDAGAGASSGGAANNYGGGGADTTAGAPGVIVLTYSTVPGAPTIGSAIGASATSATVTWTAPGSNGGSAITGYTITPFPAGSSTTVGVVTTGTATGLTAGPYTFKVAAINANGTGSPSASSNLAYVGSTGSLAGTFGGTGTGISYAGRGTGVLAGAFGGSATAILGLHPTGALGGTFGGSAGGVLTYYSSGSMVGTFGGMAAPVPGNLLPPDVSAVAGYDGTTPIITITVVPNILNIFGEFNLGITLLRNDGTYVIGASPLDYLVFSSHTVSVAIVDEMAPYGLPTTYIAAATILGGAISPPSVPSLPVMMGQAPDTTDLYNRMGWAQDEDTSGLLEQWLSGIGGMLQIVDNLVRDGEGLDDTPAPGWSQVLDINRAPTYVLPWLAQFLGVRLDPALRDDEMRYQIENPAGFARGTPGYIIARANQYMIPGWTIVLHERDTSPYHLSIDVPQAGVAGVSSYLSIWQENPTYAAIQANYATYQAIWFIDSEIIAAIDATIPGGIMYVINFT